MTDELVNCNRVLAGNCCCWYSHEAKSLGKRRRVDHAARLPHHGQPSQESRPWHSQTNARTG